MRSGGVASPPPALHTSFNPWTLCTKLHLNLVPLGDVVPSDLPDLFERVREMVAGASAFEVELGRLGGLPNSDRPRILWSGIEGSHKNLQTIACWPTVPPVGSIPPHSGARIQSHLVHRNLKKIMR